MKHCVSLGIIVTGIAWLLGCQPRIATLPPLTTPIPQNTATPTTSQNKADLSPPDPIPFPLSEPGPYDTGKQEYTIIDNHRNGREIGITLWYPALSHTETDGHALPDFKRRTLSLDSDRARLGQIFVPVPSGFPRFCNGHRPVS